MSNEETDLRIGALLRELPTPGSDLFVLQVERRIDAEMRLDAARRAAWRRAFRETFATAAIIAAFVFLARLSPEVPADGLTFASPAMAAMLLLALWLTVGLREARV